MAVIKIKNNETGNVEVKDVGEIFSHVRQLSVEDGTVEDTISDLPVHEMLESISIVGDNHQNPTIECTYAVRFENRLLRVRPNVLSAKVPRPLYNLLGLTEQSEGMYLTEREGLRFQVTIHKSTQNLPTDALKYPFRGRKVLPNIFNDHRICFGSTHFRTPQSSATTFYDAGRMLQSFFGSTFNADLSDTCVSDGERTKRNIINFLQERGHDTLVAAVQNLQPQQFSKVYTIWAIASYSKESLSSFERLLV